METENTTKAKLKDLESRNDLAILGGGQKRIEKQKQGGRLTARERLDILLDRFI